MEGNGTNNIDLLKKMNLLEYLWVAKYALLIGLGLFVLQTATRELSLAPHLQPFFYVKALGHIFEICYGYIGTFLGYVSYLFCLIFRFMSENLFNSIKQTFFELIDALDPYFHFYLIWDGCKKIVWDFFTTYYMEIFTGFAMTIILTSLVLGWIYREKL